MRKAVFLDDEPLIINSFKRILRPLQSHMEIRFFTSPSDAEDFIRKEFPEFCFTDYKMPGINGIDFILKMKRDSPDTHFYILSGEGHDNQFKRPEITGILNKPCSYSILENVLKGGK